MLKFFFILYILYSDFECLDSSVETFSVWDVSLLCVTPGVVAV